MIRQYELGLVINPDLSEEQIEAQVLRIGQAIEGQGGQVMHLDRWGRRHLAYPINRHRDGYYAFIDMQLESTVVHDVQQVLDVQEEVLRSLLTMIDPRTIAERQRRRELEATRIAQAAARAEAMAHANTEAANQAATHTTDTEETSAEPVATAAPEEALAPPTATAAVEEATAAPAETAAPEEVPAAPSATEDEPETGK
jgi:small subunit ribosomal protein S6